MFGSVSAVAKPALTSVNPILLGGFVYLLAAVVATPLIRKKKMSFTRADKILILGITLSGSVVGPLLFFIGLENSKASDSALLLNGEIVFSVFLALLIFREKIQRFGYVAVALMIIGIIIVTTDLEFSLSVLDFQNRGNLLIISATLFWALDNNLSRILSERLDTARIDLQINKASLESQHYDFISDLRYEAKSIHQDQLDNTFTIKNNGKYDSFIRNTIWLTAYCDFDGNPDSYDKKIAEEEIIVRNQGDRGSTSFTIPSEILNENIRTFGLRLIVESYPYTSGGQLESIEDHKKTSIQYVYNDERSVWQPSIVINDGGFSCSREPYGSDVNAFYTTNEEDFQECYSCYD